MHDAPLISVIVPIYNNEKFLPKCIDSILAQTYSHLEIILVDDGSADSSGEICDQYAQKEARVKVIHQQNQGISAARNAGIAAAKGEYISFIDSDDWVDATFIENLLQTARENNALIAVVGIYEVFPEGICQNQISLKPNEKKVFAASHGNFTAEESLELLLVKMDRYVADKLYHRSLFEYALFPVGMVYEDIWILYRLLQRMDKVAVYNAPLYYYNRCNENSISKGKFTHKQLDYFKVFDEFMADAKTFKSKRILRLLQRERLGHICGFFKRMMNSNFNDWTIIKPMQQELRRNLWLLLRYPKPLFVSIFGIACAISFTMTKWFWQYMPQRVRGY